MPDALQRGLGLVSPYLTRPLMDVVLVPPLARRYPSEQRYWLGLIVLGMLSRQVCGQSINLSRGGSPRGSLTSWPTISGYSSIAPPVLSLRYFDKRRPARSCRG